ncbi:18S rRNA (guanine-N(7))-methyltransferase-like, partial [Pempheris klunzingeri]|uniref:18S rRNA (guanine-N(7))-methyltransferase-like n=1 Tax=Pempheris klunzingeri TaxID=3127111 RepID=UPI0039806706
YYGVDEANKYTKNSRIITETKMAERTLELLNLSYNQTNLILDIGCGTGISGQVLTDAGCLWIGLDISEAMLNIANEKDLEGGLIECDMGNGLPFRSEMFDGCISLSALQWLSYVSKSEHNAIARIYKFFSTLYSVLKLGSRAVFQFYPDSPDQIELFTKYALKAGFTGGVLVDYPNSTKAK